mmetsp:Transcript_50494/g.124115  ORF Transcript_50494/g.124115 Transcript_50494/m.124115 type:complete len:183 (-) Transcript_50494:748-1296(-)
MGLLQHAGWYDAFSVVFVVAVLFYEPIYSATLFDDAKVVARLGVAEQRQRYYDDYSGLLHYMPYWLRSQGPPPEAYSDPNAVLGLGFSAFTYGAMGYCAVHSVVLGWTLPSVPLAGLYGLAGLVILYDIADERISGHCQAQWWANHDRFSNIGHSAHFGGALAGLVVGAFHAVYLLGRRRAR